MVVEVLVIVVVVVAVVPVEVVTVKYLQYISSKNFPMSVSVSGILSCPLMPYRLRGESTPWCVEFMV